MSAQSTTAGTATTITTSTADFKPGDTVRIDDGSRPGWYLVVEVHPGTIGVDQQPGNRHERRKRLALARKKR